MNHITKTTLFRKALLLLLLAFWYYIFNKTDKLWVQIVAAVNIFLTLLAYVKNNFIKPRPS